MARAIGMALGLLMVADGVKDTINPRFGFGLWKSGLKRYFPESVNEVTGEYARLSDTALRYITVWEVLMGLVVLWLAAKVRE